MWDSETVQSMAPGLPGTSGQAAGGALDVLETMFFELPLGPVREDEPPAAGAEAYVEFEGTYRGRIEVRVDVPAAGRLTASFLGREDERTVTAPESELVLLELANMLCGAALSRIHPQSHFRLEAPRLGRPEESVEPGTWLIAPLESGRVAFRLTFKDQP
jgi:hypothetical protein